MPELTGYEKAAILLTVLGEEAAAEVLKNLDIREVGRITTEMARLKTVRREALDAVVQEVAAFVEREDLVVGDGRDYMRKVLAKGLGEEQAAKVLEAASREAPFEALKWADPWALAGILAGEHPQTIAFVLCLLEPDQAAAVLGLLDEALRVDVALRVAATERIPETAVEEIREVLEGQVEIGRGAGIKVAGKKMIAEMLNRSDRATEAQVLQKMEEVDQALAESVRQLMFVFDDLAGLDDRAVQALLKEISTEDLALALKTASEELKGKVFRNMSQRAAEILKEEMAVKGPVRVSEVEKAQQRIVAAARNLEQEGKIVIAGKGKEEVVV